MLLVIYLGPKEKKVELNHKFFIINKHLITMAKTKTKSTTKSKSTTTQKLTVNSENQESLINYFAEELFHNTTIPQMLGMVRDQAFNYARSQITGDQMPESEKVKILERMIDFEKRQKENSDG